MLWRPSPRNPAELPKLPWLIWPHPKRNSSNTSVEVKVSLSLPKNPTENDLSPYCMSYIHVELSVEQRGILCVTGVC